MLGYFQKAKNSKDPASADEIGDGALMNQGWTLLWMGWQWDVPAGQMRMDMPIATDNGKTHHGDGARQFHSQRSFAHPALGRPQPLRLSDRRSQQTGKCDDGQGQFRRSGRK